MIRRILVPLDGSELAERILSNVADLARRLPAEVWFVQVLDPDPAALAMDPASVWTVSDVVVYEGLDSDVRDVLSYLGGLVAKWQQRGVVAHSQVLRGEAAPEIVQFARSHEFDLIAMSTHGRTGLGHAILGSVVERVVLDSRLLVLVVRPVEQPDTEPNGGGEEDPRRLRRVVEEMTDCAASTALQPEQERSEGDSFGRGSFPLQARRERPDPRRAGRERRRAQPRAPAHRRAAARGGEPDERGRRLVPRP